MEMGKLTAKLRDAVPVCLLVEGKEIKRYKNIEIPDELKKLEYQDFKFDVPLNGAITFKPSCSSRAYYPRYSRRRESGEPGSPCPKKHSRRKRHLRRTWRRRQNPSSNR